MNRHAIIVIKNDFNEYLQYFDVRWDSYLFLNCKFDDKFNYGTVKKHISEKLKIDQEEIKCYYIGKKIHMKFSESDKKEKEYEHYFVEIKIGFIPEIMKNKNFSIDNIKYCWYNYEELKNDERIKKVNSDIVSFMKEFKL